MLNSSVSSAWIARLRQQALIAVIRAPSLDLGRHMAQAIARAGIQFIEITWNSASADRLIGELRTELPRCTIGTGTILTLDQMQDAIAAGAQFLFSPHTNADLIRTAVEHQVPIIPGALSPTEIVTAWQAGASSVKVFPIDAVGGASYIRSLQGPLGSIPLIPTGGVTMDNAPQFIEAGAIAVGLSSQLFPKQAIAAGDWDLITHRAATLQEKLAVGQSSPG